MNLSLKVVSSLLAMTFGFSAIAVAADTEEQAATEIKEVKTYVGLATEQDQVSYILGSMLGKSIKGSFDFVVEDFFIKGLYSTLDGKDLLIPKEEHPEIINTINTLYSAKAGGQEKPEVKPLKDFPGFKNDAEKESYIIGLSITTQFKSIPYEFSSAKMASGFSDAFNGKTIIIPEADQQGIMTAFETNLSEKMRKQQEEQAAKVAWKLKLEKPKMMTFDKDKDYFWVIQTNKGTIKLKLWPDIAPMHVTSTIFLTKKGFYDDIVFHRVIPGFMAQGGCPLGTGTGDAGYEYDGECKDNVKFDRPYLLAMANTGQPTSDGSQFFITYTPTPHLNGKHTIFGEVVEGMKVVDTLAEFGSESGRTSEELKIVKATIEEAAKKQ